MKKGHAAARLLEGEHLNGEPLTVSVPQVMLVGELRYTRRATELARILQALITIFRPKERMDSVGYPQAWNTVQNFDGVETTFSSDQLCLRLDELGLEVSRNKIAGILSNVVRKGTFAFAAVGYPLPSHTDGLVSKQSMAPALMGFGVRFNPYPEGTWTITLHVKHQQADDDHDWHGNEIINQNIRELYEDQVPEAHRDILEHTCIPNGADWLINHHEGYRRWE